MIGLEANETCVRSATFARVCRDSGRVEARSWPHASPGSIPRVAGQKAPGDIESRSPTRPCPYEALTRLSSEARRQLMAEADRENLPLGQVVRRRFFGLA
jgi:hypothetical protein